MRRAALDLGTNSCLLLVLDHDGSPILDQALVVGLGRGLGDTGALAHDRKLHALEVLATYTARAQIFGVRPDAVVATGTSALRRATDAHDFLTRVQRATGLRFRVIPGGLEARLAWLGASSVDAARVCVLDIGGGSTELAWGRVGADAPEGRVSLETGTVRATETFLGTGTHDPAGVPRLQEHLEGLLAQVDVPAVDRVVGIAGTALTLAAHHAGQTRWDLPALADHPVPVTWMTALADRFLPMSLAKRQAALPVSPERADYVVAGATIAATVVRHLGLDVLHSSIRDTRHGALAAQDLGLLPDAPDRLRSPGSRE